MIFNEIKCRVNTSLGLVGDASPASLPLCPRLGITTSFIVVILRIKDKIVVENDCCL